MVENTQNESMFEIFTFDLTKACKKTEFNQFYTDNFAGVRI